MSSRATGSDDGILLFTSALSGADGVTAKSSSGIEVETPGLQSAVSRRSFGSAISRATGCKAGLVRRFEGWTRNSGADGVTAKSSSGIEVETPGLQSAVSGRSFGSAISRATGCKAGLVRRFEAWTRNEVYFRHLVTEAIEYLEGAEKDSGVWFKRPSQRMVRFRGWGWDRLSPYVYNLRYLEEFYWRNVKASGVQSATTLAQQPTVCATPGVNLVYLRGKKVPGSTQSDATTTWQQNANSADADYNLAIVLVYLSCKKEAELVSEWRKKGIRVVSPEIKLSTSIRKEIISLVLPKKKKPIPTIPPAIYDCINCIIKEAELNLEWLRLGLRPYGSLHDLSHGIRNLVFSLIQKYSRAEPCCASVATCALLLGITKESELVCKKLRQDDDILSQEINLSTEIRTSALDMLEIDMDAYVLKRAPTDGFCYRSHFDLHTWLERKDTKLGKVHVDGAHELTKGNRATKNKLEEDETVVFKKKEDETVNGITRGYDELSRKIIRPKTSCKRVCQSTA